MAVKKGDKVKVEYIGTLDNGTVFDDSKKHGQPLEFEAGGGKVIRGFDEAVIGMGKGEEKNVRIEAHNAYGDYRPELVKEMPRKVIESGPEPKAGMMLVLSTPDGRKFPALIKAVGEETLTIDLNHPLAGKALNFKIKVVEISS